METERSIKSGSLGLGATAALSVVVLLGAIGWRIEGMLNTSNSSLSSVASVATGDHSAIPENNPSNQISAATGTIATSTDPFAPQVIGDNIVSALALEYTTLKANGTYSATTAAQAAQSIGANIMADVTFKTYTAGDIPTTPDTSYAAMLAYRSKLQVTLKPLMKNTKSEIDLLTSFEQTKDPSYLSELQQASGNYKLAIAGTAAVAVPADAVQAQLGILNAMQEFTATLDQMVASSNDALAEGALINTYLQAQQDMTTSFNDLYTYYKSKQK